MERDMELVRKILVLVAEEPSSMAPRLIAPEGYTSEQVAYHVQIMADAGLVVGEAVTSRGRAVQANIQRLTWAGHEFLDAARVPSRWKAAKQLVTAAGSVSFQVLAALLTDLARKEVGLA